MSAFFIKWKKIAGVATGVLSVSFTFSAFFYAKSLENAQTVGAEKHFYFLVSNEESVQASTEMISLQGGAGYALVQEKDTYAAYAVYFSENDSMDAQSSVLEMGQSTKIVEVSCAPLYLKTAKEKERAKLIAGAFESLYGCMQVLNGEIKRLERGATQESSKRILQTLFKQFSFLKKQYAERVAGYGNACKNAKKRLSESISNIVYAKDLRYLLCELSVAYANLSKNFSL